MSRKIFCLGVGAQKSGTTWLHRCLNRSPQVDLGFTKEYHVFDTVTLPKGQKRLERLRSKLNEGVDGEAGSSRRDNVLRRRIEFCKDPTTYYDYFETVLAPAEVLVTGDISPGYCALSAQTFSDIKTNFATRDIYTKTVFIMRDPVDRCWSAVRMRGRKEEPRRGFKALANTEEGILVQRYRSPLFSDRTRYDQTIKTLLNSFDRSDVLFLFYESLFTVKTVGRICDFLSIEPFEADLETRVNPSPPLDDLPGEIVAEIAQYYRETYRFVADYFSDEPISEMWPSARLVL